MESVISVVVVTFKRPNDVKETISSLLNQTVKPLEIIVIDDGSTLSASTKFESNNLKWISFCEEMGLSNARNYGVGISKADYIAFIDDDAVADKHWLEEIQKGVAKAPVLGGPIRPIYQAQPPDWWDEEVFGGSVGIGNNNGDIWGTNLVVKKEVFDAIGFFSSKIGRQKGKLLGGEETEFIDRARRKGFTSQFVKTAVVYHKVSAKRMTLGYLFRWNYYEGRSEKATDGFHPLTTVYNMLLCMIIIISPRIITSLFPRHLRLLKTTSGKTYRIGKIAWLATLIGKLF
jgi:GT2 family glycosyltransferase